VKAVGSGDSPHDELMTATGDAGSSSDIQRQDSHCVKSLPSETDQQCANCSSFVTLPESHRDIIQQNKVGVCVFFF